MSLAKPPSNSNLNNFAGFTKHDQRKPLLPKSKFYPQEEEANDGGNVGVNVNDSENESSHHSDGGGGSVVSVDNENVRVTETDSAVESLSSNDTRLRSYSSGNRLLSESDSSEGGGVSDIRERERFASLQVFNIELCDDVQCAETMKRWLAHHHNAPFFYALCVNDLVEKHYDSGLKPNTLHIALQYAQYIIAYQRFEATFPPNVIRPDRDSQSFRCNLDFLLCLFVACKVDEGQAMRRRLFAGIPAANLNHKPPSCDCGSPNCDSFDFALDVDWLARKECSFIVAKLRGNTVQSTRFEYLLAYLQRIGFQTDSCIAEGYKAVKSTWQQVTGAVASQLDRQGILEHETLVNIHFGFLCRYVLEMSYYRLSLACTWSKREIAVAAIYAAYVIAHAFPDKFRFGCLHTPADLVQQLGDVDFIRDARMCQLVQHLIRIARSPNVCRERCFHGDDESNTTGARCTCLLHWEINTHLKYCKAAYGKVAHFGILATEQSMYGFRTYLSLLEKQAVPAPGV